MKNRWAKIALGAALVVSTVAVLMIGGRRFMDQRQTTAEITRLREDLYRARVSSDRCRNSLAGSESSLRTLTATIDSIRSRVDSFEALGGGRVPSERYEEYLGVFDSYNDSVAAWEIRSERLLTAEASCRAVIEEHNALSDSIQALLEGAGITG
ncbi:MAG: hypothetical protein OEO79_15755 [Gemmatimonadota bacterium]|nr:hypothetical protein [Gemmatimonadota bacterium]MDH3421593.1 hypothetical protein [Gemmatimonadota bacterium]